MGRSNRHMRFIDHSQATQIWLTETPLAVHWRSICCNGPTRCFVLWVATGYPRNDNTTSENAS